MEKKLSSARVGKEKQCHGLVLGECNCISLCANLGIFKYLYPTRKLRNFGLKISDVMKKKGLF